LPADLAQRIAFAFRLLLLFVGAHQLEYQRFGGPASVVANFCEEPGSSVVPSPFRIQAEAGIFSGWTWDMALPPGNQVQEFEQFKGYGLNLLDIGRL
jgi:hypothetical protein